MKPYCLASSSKGNCYIFDFEINGDHTLLMVECGIPMKEIYSKCNDLGIKVSDIQGCLITHAHNDHCYCAKDIERLNIPIFAHKATLERINVCGNELIPLEPKRVAKGIAVFPFLVEHDIEGALGFVIKSPTETIIFINDCKTWHDSLINFHPDYVFIECNYNHKIVHKQYNDLRKALQHPNDYNDKDLKEMRQIYKQRERQINAHMSLAGTKKNLQKIQLFKCKAIFLMHLSRNFGDEYIMKNEVRENSCVATYVCGEKGGIK